MSLLSRLGLADLNTRTRRERATFFFLIAVSTFLFMDQNLMSPNLTAIGEQLVVSRQAIRERLSREDASYRALLQGQKEERAKATAAHLARLRLKLITRHPELASDRSALDQALSAAAREQISQEELELVVRVADRVKEREARTTTAFQQEVDNRLAGRASLWFWLLGGLVAVTVGWVTDKRSRKKLLFGTILVGAIPCFATGFAQTVDQFVILRALTGIGIGAVLPLTYSLVGDLFSARGRPAAAAWVGLAAGIGIASGQLLAGILGPVYGWQLPFLLVASPNILLAFLFLFFADEPKRGSGEQALHAAMEHGAEHREKIQLSDLRTLFANRTNLLVFAQGIPGSMPWGFFFTFLVDFYHSNKGFSVQAATLLVSVFGAGAILGSFVGGLAGGKLYHRKPAYLPALCCATIFAGIPPLLAIVNWADAPTSPLQRALEILALVGGTGPSVAGPAALGVLGAFLAAITSSNVKAVLIDVNPPENRGTIFSLFNLADDLGKGFAPFLIGSVLGVFLGRQTSYNVAILMWVICGLVWLVLIRVFPKDVAALEHRLSERAKVLRRKEVPAGSSVSPAIAGTRSA